MINSIQIIKIKAIIYVLLVSHILPGICLAIVPSPPNYVPAPQASKPMESLLPQRGIDHLPARGYLQINSKYLKTDHYINFDTREVEIVQYFKISGGEDSIAVYDAYYRELGAYALKLNELAMQRFWLSQFIGQSDPLAGGKTGSPLEWELPVKVPDWMKRWGADTPRLKINGSYKVIVMGTSTRGKPNSKDRWFPNFTMDNNPSFSVTGSIGRLIHIEINNEEGFGTNLKDQLKISYKGEGNELEDNIIQEIEAGNTSLSLSGTSLTGYTEQHKGLFGIKIRMKFGDLHLTTIASQEGGSQERQTLGTEEEQSEFAIDDKNISLYKHFFLELADRDAYQDTSALYGVGSQNFKNGKSGINPTLWTLVTTTKIDDIETHKAVAFALAGDNAIIDNVMEEGRWQELKAGTDFIYNQTLRLLTVFSGHQSMAIAARWEGDPLVAKYGLPFYSNDTLILIKTRSVPRPGSELDRLMWRNVYSIGKIEPKDKENFQIRVIDNNKSEIKDSKKLTSILGLTNPQNPSLIWYDNVNIFDFANGIMILPCHAYDTVSPGSDGNCLTPLKRISPQTLIYEKPSDEIRNLTYSHQFLVIGKQRKSTFDVRRSSHSVSGSGCLDITPGTEKLTLNGSTVLEKDIDYEVLYEAGQITLLSLRAKAPNNTIDISYECTPFFQIQDKVLLGTRLEYNLDAISDQSLIGATFLYKSQTTTAERPQLGREPFNQFLWGLNTKFAGNPDWMTSLVNFVPFINTKAKSNLDFRFELAQSYFNPNTKGSALLDDFEGSKREFQLPMHIYSWNQASPPGNSSEGDIYNEFLDYRHKGDFIWHTNLTEQFHRIYGRTSNARTDSREVRLMKFIFQPNDNLRGNSWGGIMRGFTPGLHNQSRKRLLEVVVRGREGNLYFDMGQISEDISIAGQPPDGELNAEVQPGEFTNEDDNGLDALKSGEGETGQKWECKPICFPISLKDHSDPALDDWEEPNEGETNPSYKINGTERNNINSGGLTFDSEDLNRNSVLDKVNRYVRYGVDLRENCTPSNNCEELTNGWRKYQIPLWEEETHDIISKDNAELVAILSDVNMFRIWFGQLPNGVSQSEILLARISLIGNTWEENDRNREWELEKDCFVTDKYHICSPPPVSDSNSLRMSVISNREEKDLYSPSPNTKIERDPETDEPLPEQSLVMKYNNLHPGEYVSATRILESDQKDLTLYHSMLLEVHPEGLNDKNQNQISFALQIGRDDVNGESNNYYEIKIHIDSTINSQTSSDSIWLKHALSIPISDLAELKNNDTWKTQAQYSKKSFIAARGDSSLTLSVFGTPSLSQINWMRLVIFVDSNAREMQSGELWVNDLRLEGINKDNGSSITTSLQADFGDFINLSGNISYRNGEFVTLTESAKTPASSSSRIDYNTNAGFYANKFFPDEWGLSLPFNLKQSGSITRPFTKQPVSDILLVDHDLKSFIRDFYNGELETVDTVSDRELLKSRLEQSSSISRTFSTSFRKNRTSSNFFIQSFLERPELEYSYSLRRNSAPFRQDTTSDYKARILYNLSPFGTHRYHPLSFSQKWKYVPEFISNFEISPLPDRFALTLADFSFIRSSSLSKDPEGRYDPVSDLSYKVSLNHGLDMAWSPLSFFNFTYRISVNRNFDEIHREFARNRFFSEVGNGFMAHKIIFGLDSAEALKGLNVYGILANENNRNQSYQMDLSPRLLSWLDVGGRFSSGYQHTRNRGVYQAGIDTTPQFFEASTHHDINFNAGFRPNSFFQSLETSTSKIKWLSNSFGVIRKGIDKLKLNSVDGNYSISHRFEGEQFTFDSLNSMNISTPSFYLYQLGLIYSPSALWDYDQFIDEIILGKTDPLHFDYLTPPMVQGNSMSHNVTRSADMRSSLTIPILDLNLNGNVKWSLSYSFPRDHNQWKSHDTSLTWPEFGLSGRLSNLTEKISFLKKNFQSFALNSSYNYQEETKFNIYSISTESKSVSHKLNPLLKISATGKNNVRYDNGFNFSHSLNTSRSKLNNEPFNILVRVYNGYDTLAGYPLDPVNYSEEETIGLGDVFTVSYDIQTRKGVQFWRWYVKLENNLRLKFTAEGSWDRKTTTRFSSSPPDPKPESHWVRFKIRPELSYNFTRKIDALIYAQYSREQEFHTSKDETSHEVEIHGEFTMRF